MAGGNSEDGFVVDVVWGAAVGVAPADADLPRLPDLRPFFAALPALLRLDFGLWLLCSAAGDVTAGLLGMVSPGPNFWANRLGTSGRTLSCRKDSTACSTEEPGSTGRMIGGGSAAVIPNLFLISGMALTRAFTTDPSHSRSSRVNCLRGRCSHASDSFWTFSLMVVVVVVVTALFLLHFVIADQFANEVVLVCDPVS